MATIRFEMPEASEARLAVYDLTGRQVCVLADGPREAGAHVAIWNGRNDVGEEAGSGIYFVKMVTAKQELGRKIVLVR